MNRSARPHSDFPCPDQDETFAYIAGYTEGGFAYGVTWEEWGTTRREFKLFRVGIERKPPGRKAI